MEKDGDQKELCRAETLFMNRSRAEMPNRKALDVLERVQAKLTGRDYAKVCALL